LTKFNFTHFNYKNDNCHNHHRIYAFAETSSRPNVVSAKESSKDVWRDSTTFRYPQNGPFVVLKHSKGFLSQKNVEEKDNERVNEGGKRVQVNQRLHFPLSTTYFPLLSAFCSMSTFRPNDNVSMGVTLACYQQAGSDGKYIDVSRKWSC